MCDEVNGDCGAVDPKREKVFRDEKWRMRQRQVLGVLALAPAPTHEPVTFDWRELVQLLLKASDVGVEAAMESTSRVLDAAVAERAEEKQAAAPAPAQPQEATAAA